MHFFSSFSESSMFLPCLESLVFCIENNDNYLAEFFLLESGRHIAEKSAKNIEKLSSKSIYAILWT